jgi:hypothetical protein
MEYYGLYGFAHPIKTSNVPNVPPSSAELHCVAPWRTSEWSHRVSADLTAGTRHLFHLVNDLFAKNKKDLNNINIQNYLGVNRKTT